MSDTKDPLTDINARIAEIEARRAARAAAAETPEAKLAAKTMQLSDLEAIEDAICKYGPEGKEISYVYTDKGVVIVKRPAAPTFKKFQDTEDPKTSHILALIQPCVVYPTLPEFSAIIEYWPAVLGALATLVGRLAGTRISADSGK